MVGTDDAWVGHVIDRRYRLDLRIARGGFGTVYRAFHFGFERPVAVKLLRVEPEVAVVLGDARNKLVADLRTEGGLLARLSTLTTGTVQALDVGDTTSSTGEWAPYLVLEWVDGEELGKYAARRGKMLLDEIVALLDPVARALEAAHSLGIAHRDVKPGNILVTQVGSRQQTKLLDFGVAKVMTDAVLERARAATRLSFLAFTPAWAAPEQFDPSLGRTGSWTDVYAFALVLVSLLSGHQPYGETGLELAMRALDKERRPTPRTLGLEVSEAVELVFARAVAIDPRNRYATAGELWSALQRASLRAPQPSATSGSAARTIATSAPAAPLLDSGQTPSSMTSAPTSVFVPSAPTATAALGLASSPLALEPTMPVEHVHGTSTRKNTRKALLASVAAIVVGIATWRAWSFVDGSSNGVSHASDTSADDSDSSAKTKHAKKKPPAATVHPPTMPMVFIQGGTGIFGVKDKLPANTYDEEQTTDVVASFSMDKYETSVAEYRECVEAGACSEPRRGKDTENIPADCNFDPPKNDEPVNCVSFPQASAYCEWKGKRLPTYREWEFAARGSAGRPYPWGATEPTCAMAIFGENCTHGGPAAARSATQDVTPEGVFHLAGNVVEWTAGTIVHPTNGLAHAAFGGDWMSKRDRLRSFRHYLWVPETAGPALGFRCAKSE